MKKILIVIDMQNDFITGSLKNPEAEKIIPEIREKIAQYVQNGDVVAYTRDTHFDNYLSTQEGKKLPVKHCIKGESGWEICDELKMYAKNIIDKDTFGSVFLSDVIREFPEDPDEIELCGLCTDICVISNAMILKAEFPEAKISVIGNCCAGVTEESHKTALNAMKACQIEII